MACLLWGLGMALFFDPLPTFIVYVLSILSFVLFSIGIFWWSRIIVDAGNLYTFNGVVSISFIIKLLMAIASVWNYENIANPDNDFHLLHYILIYLVYTGYEVYFLTELGHETPS